MNLQSALDWRYATQEFDIKKELESEKLDILLEAARKAPSSMNFQPWKFIVVKNDEVKEKIQEAAFGQLKVSQAPILLVIAHRTELIQSDVDDVIDATKKERGATEEDLAGYRAMLEGFLKGKSSEFLKQWSKEQSFISLGVLLSQAAQLQVDAGPMGGFNPDQVDEILGLNKVGYASTALVSLGYRSSSDESANRSKVRFSKEHVIDIRK